MHLLELAGELERRLAEIGRLEWAREECAPLCQSSDVRDLETVFARLPRVRGLSASAQTIARELVRWREEIAATQDRPVQRVLADAALVEIAKRKPTSPAKLEQIRGVNQGSLRRRGAGPAGRGATRRRAPAARAATQDARPPASEPDDAPLVALAEALVRARAREAGLAYELLAARADLQAIVAAGAERRGGRRPHAARLAARAGRQRAAGAARRPGLAVGARRTAAPRKLHIAL